MKRTSEDLIRRVREELRAEGQDGAGYSHFIILDAINSALDHLSEIFTIRDVVSFTTTVGVNAYNLAQIIGTEIFTILRITYNNVLIKSIQLDDFLELAAPTAGVVNKWLLWGTQLTLVGAVEADRTVRLWVNRAPNVLIASNDTADTPRYADEAIIAYAISVCYRESRDYERATFHYNLYLTYKNELLRRAVPQGHKDSNVTMRDSYTAPFESTKSFRTSDTNPGGR